MKKKYVLDTNVLIDNSEAITILRNGVENEIFIPEIVISELDNLKKNPRLSGNVSQIIDTLFQEEDHYTIIKCTKTEKCKNNDDIILQTIIETSNCDKIPISGLILVSNDKILRFKAKLKGITSEEFNTSIPFKSEAELYTGFINEGEEIVQNSFGVIDNQLHRLNTDGNHWKIDYDNKVWKVSPKNITQNAFFNLAMDDKVKLISMNGSPGQGKTYCSLATAFHLVFQMKKHKKIYVFKPNIEIGYELGFLPGTIDEKMDPYFKPIRNNIKKLLKVREYNRIYKNKETEEFDDKVIELLPINFLRGDTIEDAVVICSEFQNYSREETRTILSRMGNNVKCICEGDINQIDNRHLNNYNNGINWMVKCLKDSSEYGHISLEGKTSRGPIASLVNEREL